MKDKIIFLDTETTWIEEPWLIQLWYIICDLNFNEIKRENLFFKTDKKIEFGAMAIHHITEEILEYQIEKHPWTEEEKRRLVIQDFENAYLIAHNSPFDKNVLDINNLATPESSEWIDTYNIAYGVFTDKEMKHSLQYLRYYLGCTFSETIDAHDALSDVIVLKAVFMKLRWAIFEQNGSEIDTAEILDTMIEDTKRWIILRTWAFWKYKWRTFAETFKMDRWYFTWMYNAKIEDRNTNDAIFNTLKFYLK